ncbi:MAG TPA: peptidoglycan-binding protein [Dissulfurispiraceae bacterium]|nr:peptidoglycan-binding protein [Dissulfurispiraceae bacterium]
MNYNPIDELMKIPPENRPVLELDCQEREPEAWWTWWVRFARRCLTAHGYEGANVNADAASAYDARLAGVVHNYQSDRSLPATGQIDAATWAALAREPRPYTSAIVDDDVNHNIVKVARFMCDVLKIREHGRNNHGPEVEALLALADGSAGNPWCVAAAYTAVYLGYYLSGKTPPKMPNNIKGDPSLSCSALVKWAESDGRLITDIDQARPGDLYVYSGGPSGYKHVGILETINKTNFTSIEGNTSGDESHNTDGDGVFRKKRNSQRQKGVVIRVRP